MPGYVAIIERDDYQALRSPPFARGYVKAYGRLLGLTRASCWQAFDRLREQQSPAGENARAPGAARPLHLQRTGAGRGHRAGGPVPAGTGPVVVAGRWRALRQGRAACQCGGT